MTTIELQAREYMDLDWPVFPVNGKMPLRNSRGFYDATTDADRAREWWGEHPGRGVALATGDASGVFVIDVDTEEAMQLLRELYAEHGDEPMTVTAKTSRGYHFYFGMPQDGREVRNSAGKLGPGIDVRATGGYAILPPSPHPNGEAYAWEAGRSPDEIAVADAPDWLLDEVAKPRTEPTLEIIDSADPTPDITSEGQSDSADPTPDVIPEGQRNDALTSLAGTLRRQGATQEVMLVALTAQNEARCQPPLPAGEVQRIVQSVGRYTPSDPMGAYHLTDMGNAARFAEDHRARLMHVPSYPKWFGWDDKRWAQDETLTEVKLAKDTVQKMHRETITMTDREYAAKLSKNAYKTESAPRLSAMVSLARSELAVTPDELDTDPWLLNVANGTIDLKTGELRSHDPEDRITKLAPVAFDPEATAPVFKAFLDQVTDNRPELAAFIKRYVGCALVGKVIEHVLAIFYGLGANGKTTLINVLLTMLGDYGRTCAPGLLMMKRHDSHPTEIADLQGARLVATSEITAGRRLDEARVKQLTGGDPLKARFMGGDFFEFEPSHTPILFANHKPVILGTDLGIWRRIFLVPFDVTIPDGEQDRGLPDKLMCELPGILNWALQGCMEWQRTGLAAPDEVMAATDSYRDEMDTLADFFVRHCVIEEGAKAGASEIYTRYGVWAEASGLKKLSQKVLGRILRERGFQTENHATRRTVVYLGIRIMPIGNHMNSR